jgi:VanZ family protein
MIRFATKSGEGQRCGGKMFRFRKKSTCNHRYESGRAHLIWILLCSTATLLLLWLAVMPGESAPAGLGWDKLNHAGAIALTTGLAYLSMQPRRWAPEAAFLYGIFLGVLIEILQATMATGRAAEWGDGAADLIGAGSVWLAIKIYQRRTAPKR